MKAFMKRINNVDVDKVMAFKEDIKKNLKKRRSGEDDATTRP